MSFRTTLVLIGLLAVAVIVLIVEKWVVKSPPEQTTPTKIDTKGEKLLTDVKKEDVTGLAIRPAEGPGPFEMSKADGKWKITRPIQWPADTWDADSLVDSILEARSHGTVNVSDKKVGLDKPRFVVELTVRDKKPIKLNIGTKYPLGNQFYLRLEGQKDAKLASAGKLESRLEKPQDKLVADLRDKSLVSGSSSDIRQIEITRKGTTWVLQKQGADWQMLKPEAMPLDESEVSSITSFLSGLRAESFVTAGSPEASAADFSSPLATVWFSTQTPATQPTTRTGGTTLVFGQYESLLKEKMYVSVSSPAAVAKVSVSSTFTDKIVGGAPLDLRDRKLLDIDPSTVSKVELAMDLKATTQPATRPAKKEMVKLQRRKQEVTFGPALPPPTATKPGTGPATAAATGPATQAVAASQPATAPSSTWELASATPKADADDSKVDALLNALHPLKVKKYIDAKSPATQPVGDYVLKVHTEAAGGAKSAVHEIRLRDPGSDKPLEGTYNTLRFELDRDLLTKLEVTWKK